jgi:ABC-type glycerol-3-phosphate transport system substrate-binding protein
MRKTALTLALLVMTLVVGIVIPTSAQDDTIHLTLIVPQFQEDFFKNTVVPQFESANPGITLHIKTTPGLSTFPYPEIPVEDYLDEVAEVVSSADVFMLDTPSLTSEATRAGYLLDLKPLADSDTSLNSDDFFPAFWDAFQSDNGLWALPLSADIISMMYDPAAFDAAGLAYPTDSWTLAEYENAIRALATLNAEGSVETPGLFDIGNSMEVFLIALLGDDVVDDTVQPGIPDYTNPGLESLLNTWAELEGDGYVNFPYGSLNGPLMFGSVMMAAGSFTEGEVKTPIALPGGVVGANVYGYGVSAGTRYPEAAYTLAKFLTNMPELSASFFGSTPARRSLANSASVGGAGIQIQRPSSPEIDALIELGRENALTGMDLYFARNLSSITREMSENGTDARTALNTASEEILSRLQTADERRNTPVTVALPELAPELAPGEVALKFGAAAPIMPFPNEAGWLEAAEAFAAEDPEVGYVEFEGGFPEPLEQMTQKYDCFYYQSNLVNSGNVSFLRSIDPLAAADTSFEPSDFIGSTLSQVQIDGQTYAYPMTIQPAVMRYSTTLFEEAGATLPINGTWTTDEFEQALRTLKEGLDGAVPFKPRALDSGYLLSLIAAYGGLPIDTTTTPPTINYTDPATIEAIRQVLDLAREGYIDYMPLTGERGGTFTMGGSETDAIYTELMSLGGGGGMIVIQVSGGDEGAELPTNPDPMVTFPGGSRYTPVTYDLGAGYISANSANAEACYRFLSYVAQQGDLFFGMPARQSMLSNSAYTASQTAETLAFYNGLVEQLNRPNAVSIPTISPFGSDGSYIMTLWLTRAFDRYVETGADLEAELQNAETFTRSYLECAATPPDVERNSMEYFEFFNECARQVDPTIADSM